MSEDGTFLPAIAFFDLDGTLVQGQTQVLLVKFLRRAGVVSAGFVLGTALWFLAYKAHLVKVTQEAREKGARVLAGLTTDQVQGLAARFADEVMLPRLHAGATAALAEHQRQGHQVVVLSAALSPVVEAFCQRLGVSEWAGASCEVAEGCYTGRLSGPMPHGPEKARWAKAYAERHGVDLADCWAYADHETDLDLLCLVGHPVAVSPKPGLREEALKAGWPVLT
ncbi:MAG: HAD family hydrolase [Thermoleophilia bacterium]|nr:HAD family hydrolase [Thermoleophilia bacterium]